MPKVDQKLTSKLIFEQPSLPTGFDIVACIRLAFIAFLLCFCLSASAFSFPSLLGYHEKLRVVMQSYRTAAASCWKLKPTYCMHA